MNHNQSTWICCQIGAREHYAIPRALHQAGLKSLITDTWITPNNPLNLLPKFCLTNLRERHHAELNTAPVKAFNNYQIAWELAHKYQSIDPWDKIVARNLWWQKQVIKILERSTTKDKQITLFAYSYAALELFKYAKSRGWKTVLGQIDPGIIEEKLVFKKAQQHPDLQSTISTAPLQYWSDWRQECTLADRIITNSDWSSLALQKTGVPSNKIKTIPPAYQPSSAAKEFNRNYPHNFSNKRPLKVLFLGQVIIRKGIAAILESINLLTNEPIEFWFVGKVKISIPQQFKNTPQIKWLGAVSRSTTSHYYQQADVFLFPTHSDGFGLTQLEAQSWKLPLITSEFCGAVVKDGINGLILPNITGKAIAEALTFCVHNPQQLAKFSDNSAQALTNFNLNKLNQELKTINVV